jgi:hypothetical protein
MSLRFLAFHQTSGFGDTLPLDVMTKVFGKMAKANPKSTLADMPGAVALWWDRANRPGTLTLETADGTVKRSVKSNEVVWLQNKTTVTAADADGKTRTAKVLANGEIKIEPNPQAATRRRRVP